MTVQEKLEIFKNKGWSYDPITGIILSHKNKQVKGRSCTIYVDSKNHFSVSKGQLAWYLTYNTISIIYHKDNNNLNNKLENLTTHKVLYGSNEPKTVTIRYAKKKKINKNYLNDLELTYEMIISLGKGKLTKRAEEMLLDIADGLIRKFNYYSLDDKLDCKMSGIYMMFKNWNKFDPQRYNKSFAYFSEICKRGFAAEINVVRGIDKNKIVPKMYGLDYKK